jgi:hypothetical protein
MVVNCEQVWREISNYVEGDVDPGLRAEMDAHLRTCQRCSSVLAGVQNVVRLYGDERMLEVPAGFGQRLERKLTASLRESSRPAWRMWFVPVAALALVVGGLELASSHVLSPGPRSEHAQPGQNIPPGMLVVVAQGTKVFHAPGCSFIHQKDGLRTLTAKEALREGYVPCTRCLRKYLEVAARPRGETPGDAGSEENEARAHGD